jgi:hypothetical protein
MLEITVSAELELFILKSIATLSVFMVFDVLWAVRTVSEFNDTFCAAVKTLAVFNNGTLADRAPSGMFDRVLEDPEMVLLVNVSVVSRPTKVSVVVGKVRVLPELVSVGEFMIGDVRVLLVKVSVVARPTRVSVDVGRVNVPVLLMVDITGLVNVLLVSVWV